MVIPPEAGLTVKVLSPEKSVIGMGQIRGQEIAGDLWRDPSVIPRYLRKGSKFASEVENIHTVLRQSTNKQVPRIPGPNMERLKRLEPFSSEIHGEKDGAKGVMGGCPMITF